MNELDDRTPLANAAALPRASEPVQAEEEDDDFDDDFDDEWDEEFEEEDPTDDDPEGGDSAEQGWAAETFRKPS